MAGDLDRLLIIGTQELGMSDSVVGQRVMLRTFDPDAGYTLRPPPGGWPTLTGRLSDRLTGLKGWTWYLVDLDEPPPAHLYDEIPKAIPLRDVRRVFTSPLPPMPDSAVPNDYIGDALSEDQSAVVLLRILEPGTLPPSQVTSGDLDAGRFPALAVARMTKE
jgi:hypothetical protein